MRRLWMARMSENHSRNLITVIAKESRHPSNLITSFGGGKKQDRRSSLHAHRKFRQFNNDGGAHTPTPAMPKGNISGNGIRLFRALEKPSASVYYKQKLPTIYPSVPFILLLISIFLYFLYTFIALFPNKICHNPTLKIPRTVFLIKSHPGFKGDLIN